MNVWSRRIAVLVVVGLFALVGNAIWSGGGGSAPNGASGVPAPRGLYVDPANPAIAQAAKWRAEGRTADATQMLKIANQPTAIWIAGDPARAQAKVREVTVAAAGANRLPVLVAYDIPLRDCGSFSTGGAPSGQAYLQWVKAFSAGLGDRPAIVVVEPDAVAQAVSGCVPADRVGERYSLLRSAVNTFGAHRNVRVYLDAGNAGWIKPPSRMIQPLQAAGVTRAAGFALNVSNFYTTKATLQYGKELSDQLGKAHFVVDTSRNGNGPAPANDALRWCNPPNRALGRTPTTQTQDPRVDAFLWVKQPGASDGACRPGAPPAGQWWASYALELTRATSSQSTASGG
jgi:endoglucanase